MQTKIPTLDPLPHMSREIKLHKINKKKKKISAFHIERKMSVESWKQAAHKKTECTKIYTDSTFRFHRIQNYCK